MRQCDRQRHQLRCLFTGVPEHQPLISRANLSACLINALIDIGRLLPDTVEYPCTAVVKAVCGISITDISHYFSGNLLHRCIRRRFQLSRNHTKTVTQQRFTCHSGIGVFLDDIVQNRIRDLVCHLVRMPFCDRFTGKNVFTSHS